ncbi:putative LRR receptor-like serine/threonine-protein kinase At1g56130 isoform X4 [Silene latifolia]|uniref:putative LRR receptor-like serine/threonine-protein kinase At1g56130 isoform X4 n=1 Tax=Silene latifolia TaxID=37657 RepID=UPI003D7751A2
MGDTGKYPTMEYNRMKVYAIDAIGVLPDDLWNLLYLTNLKISQNYLTGPLSSGIGNLTRLQYLDIGINALSGPLPKEIGQLTDLRSLGFGSNNFSGSLPSEMGNLKKLQQLYIDSSGVSGPIPSTFANLQNLQNLWASDTDLTGAIPKFIGGWSQLQVLRLEGNAFSGPIPSELSDLTSLKELDISFNSITGQIPDSLFSLSSLGYLFLGNNKLTGGLPAQKSSSLINIDVSYNQLSGSIPSWVSQLSMQLNLVANNFSDASANSRALPSGLNCVQNGFPCNSGLGRYSDFAIKCGGRQIRASNQVLYENDDETLGPANYFVTSTDKWAVSNVGLFTSNNNVTYTYVSPRQFTSLDSELFQTARLSAGSLRYYGIGLQNGKYSVLLQFAELQIENGKTWKSLGRRVFDIYIQGNRVETDFDIRKEARGQSYAPVGRNYTIQVTSNYIEIHLFWAGKGTCCIPFQGTYGPSISALSATPLFQPRPVSSTTNAKRTGVIVGVVVSVVVIALLSFAGCWYIRRKRRLRATEDELLGINAKTFSYAELRSATGDFNSSNKLGEGGFGPVFKGVLSDGRIVAVKQLSVASHQGKHQFMAEIAAISAVQHRNLVKLYGCCLEGEKRLLVYEYLENKSLDQALFGDSNLNLNWAKRFEICVGVARGLTYLHQDSSVRIVHRDVKASNILLDADLNPKISDFGLAKLYDDKKTHISTRVAGTIGYLAPEYAMRGHLTDKVDVFGFGVVALEVVSGRPNSDSTLEREQMYLLDWAWHLHENSQDVDLVDKRLSEFNEEEVRRVISVAVLCTQTSPGHRPTMSRALAMLTGSIEVGTITSKPTYLADWTFDDSTFMTSDTESSKYGYLTSQSTTTV